MADAMISAGMSMRAILLAGAVAVAGLGGPSPGALAAQEVVQGLQPREASQLSAALRRLAQRPTDLEALVSAGNASLALRDAGAASGFFTRASNVAANDPRVMLGLARVALEQGRPVAALQGFARAESAGVKPLDMAADRGLAYDLVGDNTAAQALYRSALVADEDNAEVRRRLALSEAISGNRQEFERTLYPLLRDEDRAAFRTRAFGLAVLGRPDEAVGIADAMMPTDLALRMAPYLRYMPRLTKAQQAAAGNLGAFPAAAEIGRDSPEIASYATAGARIAANASASLTPAGAPLGTRASPAQALPQSPPQTRATPATTVPVRVATSSQATPGVLGARPASVRATPSTLPATPGVLSQRPTTVAVAPARTPAPVPAPVSASTPPPVVVAAVSPTPPPALIPSPAPIPALAAAQAERQSLADAFAEFGTPATATSPSSGAVDIAKLTPARRVAAQTPPAPAPAAKPPAKPKPKPEVKKPTEPARIWVQIGVGRNTSAFAFDWRKLAKQAGGALDGKGPWAVKYGATNRMLAGPYPNDAAAKAAIKRLKDKDIEALPFSSDEGEAVTKVD